VLLNHEQRRGVDDYNSAGLLNRYNQGSAGFFAGNQKFITRKLWGLANAGPFGHAGKFTTMREAINLGHNGEATASRRAFQALSPAQQDEVVEFLKSLQVLPPGTRCLVVNEHGNCLDEEDR